MTTTKALIFLTTENRVIEYRATFLWSYTPSFISRSRGQRSRSSIRSTEPEYRNQ